MADIPNECAKICLEKLMDWTIGEARYICCFTSIAADCEKEKDKLKAKVEAVGQRVDQLKRSAQDTPADVTSWEKRASELIQEDTKTKKTCFLGWCPNCIWRYNRGKELVNKTKEITGLLKENLDIKGLPPHLPGVEYHSSQDYISFKSRELIYKELLDALADDNNYITGLHGMAGSGKTTLAIKVGQELKQSKQFDHVIDTTVSYTPNIRKIQDDIAGPLGLELKDKSESERRGLLRKRLTDGERILLILDDVWDNTLEPFKFEKIGIPKSEDHKGCKVLLTTRDLGVCRSLGCEKILELLLLTEDEAWTLFENHARISSSTSKSLVDKGREIVKECKGLPVAIAIIAGRLKGERRQEQWNAAVIYLQKPMYGVNKDLSEIYKCLWYSYEHMNNEEAKKLFLLCSLFPEDEEIPPIILNRFGIGAGLFGEVYDKYDDVRTKVAVAKNELIDSCLLLKAERGFVKMHDLVREVALLKVNKEIRAVNLSDKLQKSLVEREKGMKYLLLEGNNKDVFSYRFDGSELEILIIRCMFRDNSTEMPNSFFENMTKLRVLNLSSESQESPRLSLPQSIESLTNIRSIVLISLSLGDISILGKLQGLEALDLVCCEVVELPREIAELERLRLLHLCGCEIEKNNAFEVIERCSSLEELYFIEFEFDSSAIHDKKMTLPALQRYYIKGGSDHETFDSISKYVDVSGIDTYFSEETFKYLVQTAEILKLDEIRLGWSNLIPEIVDEGMNDLVELHLRSCSKLQCLIDNRRITSKQNVFSKLAVLNLEEMENLEELCKGPLPSDSLKSLETLFIFHCGVLGSILFKSKLNLVNLKTITLWDCPKLVTLFQLWTSQSLVLLEELEIRECEQLKNIIAYADNDNKIRKSHAPMFPNLKTLYITDCPELEFILPVLFARDVSVLKSVTIEDCAKLKYIFGKNQHENEELVLHQEVILGSWENMQLNDLPNFIDIFPECYHPKRSSVKKSSSKSQMQLNPMKFNIFPWTTSAQIPMVSTDQLQECSTSSGIKKTVEEGTTSANVKTITSSTYSKSAISSPGHLNTTERKTYSQDDGDSQLAVPSLSGVTTTEDVDVGDFLETSELEVALTKTHAPEYRGDGFLPRVAKDMVEELDEEDSNNKDIPLIRRPRPSPSDIPPHESHSHDLVDEQNMVEPCLMNQQHPLGETDIKFITLQGNNFLKETEDQSIQKGSASEKTVTTTMWTDSETRSVSLGPLLAHTEKSIKRSVEEGTTSTNAKTITSSTHSESVSSLAGPLLTSEHKTYPLEDGDGQIAKPSFSGVTTEPPTTNDEDVRDSQESSEFIVTLTRTHAPVSLNEDASMKVSSVIEEHISNPYDIGVSESKPSPIESMSPSVPFEENPSRIVEDLNFVSLVTRELEQLVSNKHLAFENLSLLIDFLVKHPSVHLNDKTLSNRYKGYAYNCLAELLKFLQIHSVKDVLETSHSDFVELLQDVRKCGFDKDWLDDVERRALFPGIQVSQDALQKLLD